MPKYRQIIKYVDMFIDDLSYNTTLIYETNKHGYYLKAVIYRYGNIRRHINHKFTANLF